MAYTSNAENPREDKLIAWSQDDKEGPLYAATYENDYGMFTRVNGTWVLLAGGYSNFEDIFMTDIDMERADEFIAAYDKGDMTVPQSDTFQVAPEEVITAAGGLDRNRGNAEDLRQYWTKGEGAAKIRWGTPGDWSRCVRHLSKYMGPRAKGYCQLRHKDALGIYTATHAKRDRAKNFNFEAEFTQVTEEDMAKTIGQLFFEVDSLFDDNWEPSEGIILALEELEDDSE